MPRYLVEKFTGLDRNYRAKSLADGLDAFSQARAENLALIASIENDRAEIEAWFAR